MSHVSDRFVAVLDANVLYPVTVRDVLLRFAEAGLYRARWSEEILREFSDRLIRRKPHLEDSIRSQLDQMAAAFPEALVEGHEPLIQGLSLPDGNDRHVLAAAIKAGAQLIVTENRKDFPEDALAPFGIETLSPDDFLLSTFELYPSQSIGALRKMRHDYENPKLTRDEFLDVLTRSGLPKTVSSVRAYMDEI